MSLYPTLDEHPFWYVYGFLLIVVFCRAQATYWLARGARKGVTHPRLTKIPLFAKVAASEDSPRMEKARQHIDRWGAPAVSVSFLTVGFQTVMNLYAGFIRMNYFRYTLSMFVGCLAWALIYTTIGSAAVLAWTNSPWTALAAGIVIATIIAFVVIRRRRNRQKETTETEPIPDSVTTH